MGVVCKVKEENLKYAVDKINYWYRKNIKYLTIITVPFNTSCIFCDIINTISNSNKKILYVWGKGVENRELIAAIREKNSTITHSFIERGSSSSDITFINYKNIAYIEGEYELVIFDDITYFSNLNGTIIRELLEFCSNMGNKIIAYCIEKISLIGEKIELAAYNYEQPFV